MKKIKAHHLLLGLVGVFLILGIVQSVLKSIRHESQKLKSDVSREVLQNKVSDPAMETLKKQNIVLTPDKIESVDVLLFKNKRQIDLIINQDNKNFVYKSQIERFSPGFGLRLSTREVTFPEGVYHVQDSGWLKSKGFYLSLDYPPKDFDTIQGLDKKGLEMDLSVIADRPFTNSFVKVPRHFIEVLIFLHQKTSKEKFRILSYPDRPPLRMELMETRYTVDIFKDLIEEYEKVKTLIK